MLSIDAVSVLVRGFTSVLRERPDVLRYTYRRGQIYNDVSRAAHCGMESPWQHGADIHQHLRSVCDSTVIIFEFYIITRLGSRVAKMPVAAIARTTCVVYNIAIRYTGHIIPLQVHSSLFTKQIEGC